MWPLVYDINGAAVVGVLAGVLYCSYIASITLAKNYPAYTSHVVMQPE